MRVSDTQLYLVQQHNLLGARARVNEAQRQAISGKRVEKPSDDPAAFGMARGLNASIARSEENLRSVSMGLATLQAADAALSDAGNILNRVRELAVGQANGNLGADERAIAATEVTELRNQMLQLANATFNGNHIFAGYQDNAPAFDAAGIYQGDTGVRSLEVAPSVRVDSGITGDSVFAPGTGVNIFQVIDNLTAALQANDQTATQATLGDIETATTQMATGRGNLGGLMESMEIARSTAERVQEGDQIARSDLVDVDIASAFSELNQANYALQSAVEIASQLPLPGLVTRGR